MKKTKTRGVFDKRTVRRIHKKRFEEAVLRQRKNLNTRDQCVVQEKDKPSKSEFSVFVRKRPIFKHELKEDFDVITTLPMGKRVVIHNCSMGVAGTPSSTRVKNVVYSNFSGVFGENDNNEVVHSSVTLPLLQHICSGNGRSVLEGVLIAFGQTGSGKTYSCDSLVSQCLTDLYEWINSDNDDLCLSISCFELFGTTIYDLLDNRKQILLLDDGSGISHPLNISCRSPHTLQASLALLRRAMNSRKTSATKINSVSSRSHAVIRVALHFASSGRMFGRLSVVDLAGSEKNMDSLFHSTEQTKDTIRINRSIMALKDCIRTFHSSSGNSLRNSSNSKKKKMMDVKKKEKYIPYRADALTRLLRQCFICPDRIKTCVLVTISPASCDTEHSRNILGYASMMNGTPVRPKYKKPLHAPPKKRRRKNKRDRPQGILGSHPRKWGERELKEWVWWVENGKFRRFVPNFPSGTNGRIVCRWSKEKLAQMCGNDVKAGSELRRLLVKQMRER